jgi:hypothetical protein
MKLSPMASACYCDLPLKTKRRWIWRLLKMFAALISVGEMEACAPISIEKKRRSIY